MRAWRMAVLALATAALAACDSGGPPAVPGPRAAAPSTTATSLDDEIVYVAEGGAVYALRPSTGEITGRRPADPGSLAYAGGRLFEVQYPRFAVSGVLTISELDPITLRPVKTLHERPAAAGASSTGEPTSAVVLLASADGMQLHLVHTELDGAAARMTVTTIALESGEVSVTDVPGAARGGYLWANLDDASGTLTIISRAWLDRRLEVFRFDLSARTPVRVDVGSAALPFDSVVWAAGGEPYTLDVPLASSEPMLRSLWADITTPLPAFDPEGATYPLPRLLRVSADGSTAYYTTSNTPHRVTRIALADGSTTGDLVLPEIAASAAEEPGFFESLLGGVADLLLGRAADAKTLNLVRPALSPDGSRLYVYGLEHEPFTGDHGIQFPDTPNGIWAIDTASMTPVAHLRPGQRWTGDLGVAPDGRRLAVVDLDENALLMLDAATGAPVARVDIDYLTTESAIIGFSGAGWHW